MTNVQGTWDFKWPQGKVIRVAFQQLTASDAAAFERPLAEIIARFKEIALRWLTKAPNIKLEFVEDQLLAPTEQLSGVYNLRSPAGWFPFEYDVLVSFASTPAVIAGGDPVTFLTGQLSVLGSYAKRINYGTPTTLVGPNRDFIPDGKTLRDYFFNDPIFDEIVLHELGHVLGIPHIHQSPLYRNRPLLKSDAAINEVLSGIRKKYWTKFSPEIAEEIRNRWPALKKSNDEVEFSDWVAYEQEDFETGRLEEHTVMAHPSWSDLTTLPGLRKARDEPHLVPTAFDLALLSAMYPPL